MRQIFWDINKNLHDLLQYSVKKNCHYTFFKLSREVNLETIYCLKDDNIG